MINYEQAARSFRKKDSGRKTMTEKGQIYKCGPCGNIVEVLHPGQGELYCCNQPMGLVQEKTQKGTDGLEQPEKAVKPVEGKEKHVPVVEPGEKGIKVKIGSVPHPMEGGHHIEWIHIIAKDGRRFRRFLKPGEVPEAEFCVKPEDVAVVREYCNVHGLWKK